ncbi:MAG: YihY/virulence factor BrkB family protein [Dysgonamonadaceae bacterium]|nr:YihY/virulence factor BrkB family protein [Dysgonamonadaceae bacterium]MDD4728716.1 YihY/virulence factor BrkB family protein [Dysgonamonadaceae bacterium]
MKESNNKKREKGKKGNLSKLKSKISDLVDFLTYEIWRLDSRHVSGKRNIFYNGVKAVIMTIRNSQELQLNVRAASLTYRTLLSLVPGLAVLFAVSRGFGLQNIIQSQLFTYFPGQQEVLLQVTEFIDNSLQHAKGGVFAGVGVILLLYTVFILFSDIEDNFNKMWQLSKGRTIQRKITDYFALIIIMPVFLVLNSGLSLMISSSTVYFDAFSYILNPLITQVLNFLPFLITILVLTLLYKFMPNTKVKFMNALIAGAVAGTAYQLFQIVYISGQLWITKYNAIYGSFAALPLLLLWLQLSWNIVLMGVQLSFSLQNVQKFYFEKETKNISRRYNDFFTILITSLIAKRFAAEKLPLTTDEISEKHAIPTRLTNQIIDLLQDLQIITPTPSQEDDEIMCYQPAFDINLMSVNSLLEKIDTYGSEDFIIDTDVEFKSHWDALMHSRINLQKDQGDVLLKDL